MLNDGKVIALDELFGLDDLQSVTELKLAELVSFKNHPFQVRDEQSDPRMAELIESVRAVGILNPLLVRPAADRKYEIISGHRRVYAAEKAGLDEVPAIIREYTDEEATILMVDSNLQREEILPSEKAWAYRMKLEAMKKQGKRNDLTSCQLGTKLVGTRSDAHLAASTEESARTIQRFIRLTYLVPGLLDLVDTRKLPMNPAVELSYLPENQQEYLLTLIPLEGAPSMKQAKRMKELSKAARLTNQIIDQIMIKVKSEPVKIVFKSDRIAQYFPNCTPAQMEERILEILDEWARQHGTEDDNETTD